MTERINKIDSLPPAVRRFVLHWGDMGGQWGVNRTVAQIHALLFMSERPLHAEEIAETLGVARSNVSNSLRELLGWGIVERVPVPGERRDHFQAEGDVWELAKRIAEVRKAREIDPALRTLAACAREARDDPAVSAEQRRRLNDMHAFTGAVAGWYDQMLGVPAPTLWKLMKMGRRIVSLLDRGKTKREKSA